MKSKLGLLLVVLLLSASPLSAGTGQCENPIIHDPFEFPPTPPHTSRYISRTFPPFGLEFNCNHTSCAFDVFQAPGSRYPLHDVYSSLLGDGNAAPYVAVNNERVVFRYKFSPSEVGYFEDLAILSSTQAGNTVCHVQKMRGSSTTPGLCVYINEDQAAGFGHTYMQLLPTRGNYSGVDFLSYGLYPRVWLTGVGRFNTESLNSWDARVCFSLTETQFDQLKASLDSDIATPPPFYNSLLRNCQHYVLGHVRDIGFSQIDSLMALFSPWEKIAPIYLLERLREVGHGNSLGPGTVVELNDNNPRAQHPVLKPKAFTTVSLDSPEFYSVVVNGVEHPAVAAEITMPDPALRGLGPISMHPGVFFPAFRDPKQLAGAIGVPLHEITLPDVHVGIGEVIIAETQENEFSAIHWGYTPVEELAWDNVDWSQVRFPSEAGAGTYFHSYDNGGIYPVTMAALWSNQRIYIYRWNIIVGALSGEETTGIHDIDIPLPDDPLFPWENGPFTPPTSPIHPGDVFFDGFETGDTSAWSN